MICYSRGMHVVCKFTLSYFRLGVLMASVPRAAWRCVGAGMTDSRHYLALSAHGALRHTPLGQSRSGGDVGRIHGTDERAALVHFHRAMCTTRRVLQLFGDGSGTASDGAGARHSPGKGHSEL